MTQLEHLRNARERAVSEDMIVTLVGAGEYDVVNKDRENRYQVKLQGAKIATCTCPQFQRAGICKHMVKVAMKSGLAVKVNN